MIVFLDLDGVTHPDGAVDQLFSRLPLLEEVLREFPRIQVVISSSRGQRHPLDQLREVFCDDIKRRIIDVTPELRTWERPTELVDYEREAQCAVWMREHRPGRPWIGLEDQAWRFHPGSDNVPMVDGATGITEHDMQRLRAWAREKERQ